ncbi:Integral membrane protein [Lysobacter dokdonensis DS-58]|uniref:Integral membrane protein n=1 Tax=Lysobacter dokdonensis DS-58 TaxID=1300345 RepID=A0A0A2WFY0_9GAMM|nr:stage II sporulation protein M [Lysobacter dokdonensis]KGQ19106.1 Integral membrane protein [Lysobacter dokdonensis DS-58]
MRQEQFVARHGAEWVVFEAWLDARADSPRRARGDRTWKGLPDEDAPHAYRRLCQQLGLARRRNYSPTVVDRLQQLMQRGHTALYRAPPPQWSRIPRFFLAEFPRLVRAEWGCMLVALLSFAVPLVGMFVLVRLHPELAASVVGQHQLAEVETMYSSAEATGKIGRESGTDIGMFGFYILNNVSIGLRTFAIGLFAGVGSLFMEVFNGVFFGAIAGHLQNVGLGPYLWRFVVGHGSFELTAIVIAGGAGLRLGLDVIAPGRRRRIDALVEGGKRGARIAMGVALMLVIAAFLEAFWSSMATLPATLMYSVAGVLWAMVFAWLAFGGRGLPDAD